MRADRLIAILLLLQNNGKMTAKELAEKLEVSERTIHRDMEALSTAGVPVYAERGTNGGWSLADGYRTNLTGMKTEEMQTLLLAHSSSLLGDLGLENSFESAFQKLLAAIPGSMHHETKKLQERIHIDGAGWHQRQELLPCLSTVQEAVWQERKLEMVYRRDEKIYERIVEPLGLVAKGSIWYLAAAADGELRTYRISRIERARITAESFRRPDHFDLAGYWEQSTKQFKAQLPRYPARISFCETVHDRLSKQPYMKIHTTDTVNSGWIEADVEFNTVESACEIILGYGALMKALEPAELREKVAAEALAVLRMYQ
ncbi:helix-turn-helix transcriptional regulator [Siminovitchia sp. 179-K 8D1 HS]|uniref:helix-turn-helix transcriptional regulator n=1 Tax=Siminovitchia sp. 179-K 8D1 HS TaxID=3142385 RepID=UPI0039A15F3B